jgi:hypothetical protein
LQRAAADPDQLPGIADRLVAAKHAAPCRRMSGYKTAGLDRSVDER